MKETSRLRSHSPGDLVDTYQKGAVDWRQRLLLRRYQFPGSGESGKDFTARIDHGGQGFYFPLGTSDVESAADRAEKIHQAADRQGWEVVCRKFSRELMVGFEWSANPILWSYTTIHTLVGPGFTNLERPLDPNLSPVLIAETDEGIARALAWCVNQQKDLQGIICSSEKSFEHAFEARKPQIVLLNRNFAGRVGFESSGRMATIRANVPALTYSCAMDGDQLFASTPGGAEGYLLKRVKPEKIFEPIHGVSGRPDFSADDMLARVKNYFKGLLQSRSSQDASALAKLTPREQEVLALLSKGCVDKEIASALGISAWTVHGHIKKIFERLKVRTRTEAVVRYLEK
ncbi:MAG TPA: response regulator transcription factor [Desulfuromonadaceae bacterium]|nr:response regulator transcription factor [Desulfuromonadaceae bacterium]